MNFSNINQPETLIHQIFKNRIVTSKKGMANQKVRAKM
jgi:hypothetical protein